MNCLCLSHHFNQSLHPLLWFTYLVSNQNYVQTCYNVQIPKSHPQRFFFPITCKFNLKIKISKQYPRLSTLEQCYPNRTFCDDGIALYLHCPVWCPLATGKYPPNFSILLLEWSSQNSDLLLSTTFPWSVFLLLLANNQNL